MKDDKRIKRKVRNSYLISTLSIALVLFLLGSVGYLMTAAMRVARGLQERVTVTVELDGSVDSVRRSAISRSIGADELVAEIVFSAKEEKIADADFRRMFEHEIEDVLVENPLFDSFEVRLTAESDDSVRLASFIRKVEGMRGVERVSYPVPMIRQLHATVGKIRLVLLIFGGALLVISLILLNNTIRLAIYSKRYLINTMKLVGATKWFIMRPFLRSSVLQGISAGISAAVLFAAAVFSLNEALPELSSLTALSKVAVILAAMMAGGVLISLLFTATAVNRFVNMKSNKIHLY